MKSKKSLKRLSLQRPSVEKLIQDQSSDGEGLKPMSRKLRRAAANAAELERVAANAAELERVTANAAELKRAAELERAAANAVKIEQATVSYRLEQAAASRRLEQLAANADTKYYGFNYTIREEIRRTHFCNKCFYKITIYYSANYSPEETEKIKIALQNGASSVRLERTGTHQRNIGQKTWHNIDFKSLTVTNEENGSVHTFTISDIPRKSKVRTYSSRMHEWCNVDQQWLFNPCSGIDENYDVYNMDPALVENLMFGSDYIFYIKNSKCK